MINGKSFNKNQSGERSRRNKTAAPMGLLENRIEERWQGNQTSCKPSQRQIRKDK